MERVAKQVPETGVKKTQSDFRIKALIISSGSLPELWLFQA